MSQIERITFIDRRLRERGAVSAAEIARRFEVSTRQALRDIEYLRDRLDAPIDWDPKSRAYRYGKPFEALRFADQKLLLFHALARSMAANESYIPVVSGEIIAELESHIARDYRPVAERIMWEIPVSERLAMDDFTTACQAMLLGMRLELAYTNAAGERSERSVEPERLINYSGRWYLVAWDLGRAALRTFHLSRAERVALGRERAAAPRPAGATPEEVERFVGSGFGMFKGSETVSARVRVRGRAAALVARQEWHPKQRVERGVEADGEPWTDLSFPVAEVTELLGRLLSFGAAAEPLEPPELRRRWEEEIGRMAALAGPAKDPQSQGGPSGAIQTSATTGGEEGR